MRRKKMKFDVVIPTYKRIKKLERMLKSVEAQGKKNFEVFVYFDNKDVDGFEHFKDRKDINCILLGSQHRAFGVWNRHLNSLIADAMFYVCDDIEFQPGCFSHVEKYFNEVFPTTDGLLGLNQKNIEKGVGFSRNAMGVIGKKFAERFPEKQVFCPDFISFGADSELGTYAREQKVFLYGEDARIIHHHPAHEKSEVDETHRIVREKTMDDKDTYRLRRGKNLIWGRTFERVR